MKIGTSIILIVAILISFGYVLSDNQKNIQRVKEISEEAENLKLKLVQSNQKVSSCQEASQANQQTIFQQSAEIAMLNDKVSNKESEIRSLQVAISQQTNKITDLDSELANLQSFKAQSDQVAGTTSNSSPIIATVIVVTQIVLAIIQKKQKMRLQLPFSSKQDNSQYVRLTADELENIISMRRTRKS